MPVERRELLRTEDGETWRLVFDRSRGTLHVEQERSAPAEPARPIHDTVEWALGEVFATGPAAVAASVRRLIEPIFPDPHPNG